MSRPETHYQLPKPALEAYFPPYGKNEILAKEIIRRAGETNLVYALEYGSHVTGDPSSTSMRDAMIVVENAKEFHQSNMSLSPTDYGRPRNPIWHAFLNRFGFNFYYMPLTDGSRAKYAVISKENFIRGCNGTLEDKERTGQGAFGLYVAGRVQKVALRPLYKDSFKNMVEIEEAINTARIDGVWLALGLLKDSFSIESLIVHYAALSYLGDLRVERRGKLMSLVHKNKDYYKRMLGPIINQFVEFGILGQISEGQFRKIESMSADEVQKRLVQIRLKTAVINYIKNPLSAGIGPGLNYAAEKIKRSLNLRSS